MLNLPGLKLSCMSYPCFLVLLLEPKNTAWERTPRRNHVCHAWQAEAGRGALVPAIFTSKAGRFAASPTAGREVTTSPRRGICVSWSVIIPICAEAPFIKASIFDESKQVFRLRPLQPLKGDLLRPASTSAVPQRVSSMSRAQREPQGWRVAPGAASEIWIDLTQKHMVFTSDQPPKSSVYYREFKKLTANGIVVRTSSM